MEIKCQENFVDRKKVIEKTFFQTKKLLQNFFPQKKCNTKKNFKTNFS